MAQGNDEQMIISYTNLRRLIGILSMSLPVLCLLGLIITATELQPSISHCYYTNVRDVFVGVVIGVSIFLVTYYGYGPIDNIVTNITGVSGILLALCPCLFSFSHPEQNCAAGYFNLNPVISNGIHVASASVFFLLLAFNSMFLFTKTDLEKIVTDNKKKRNVIYVVCGIVMVALMVAFVALYFIMGREKFDDYLIGFYIESMLLLAFGFSWLVKGDTLYRD